MLTTDADIAHPTIQVRSDPPLELFIADKAFRPNPTTIRFTRTVRVAPGDVVFDIGTGIGPLAVKAALDGAAQVYAVDPVPMHCSLAAMNATKYGVKDRVTILEGSCFEPFRQHATLKDIRADVIIGDVSGIADPVARALGWYSDQVPTGGEDGTAILTELLCEAGRHLSERGVLYFPVALDLSDSGRVFDVARECFAELENAMDRPVVQFPLSEAELKSIHDAYGGHPPDYISIQPGRRPFWRGQIWKASHPN